MLRRRLARAARRAAHAGGDADALATAEAQGLQSAQRVVAELVRLHAVDDAAFARSRARSGLQRGRSRRRIKAGLERHGVEPALAAAAAAGAGEVDPADPEPAIGRDFDSELAAALVHARRRRLGPFGVEPVAPTGTRDAAAIHRRALASLARAGFAAAVATRALDTDRDTAEALIERLRRL